MRVKILNESSIPTWNSAKSNGDYSVFGDGGRLDIFMSTNAGEKCPCIGIYKAVYRKDVLLHETRIASFIFSKLNEPTTRYTDDMLVEYQLVVEDHDNYPVVSIYSEEEASDLFDSIIQYLVKNFDFDNRKQFDRRVSSCVKTIIRKFHIAQ